MSALVAATAFSDTLIRLGSAKTRYGYYTLRASATLGTSAEITDYALCAEFNNAGLHIEYGSTADSTSISVGIEQSFDGAKWFSVPFADGTYTRTVTLSDLPGATGEYGFVVPICLVSALYVRARLYRSADGSAHVPGCVATLIPGGGI